MFRLLICLALPLAGAFLLQPFVSVSAADDKKAEEKKADDKKPDDKKTDTGWVQLFNGKDLTGWKTHPDDKARWKVEDGAIVGEGPAGHLFSEKGDYTNFI